MTEIPDKIKVKSLYKALSLLDYFTEDNPKRGVTELSTLSGMPKSVVYNILSTFEECRFVEQDQVTGLYSLGLAFLELGYRVNKINQQSMNTHELLQKLAEEAGASAFLAHRYGYKIMYRDAAYPSAQIDPQMRTGWTACMHCCALGKMLLSYESEEFVEKMAEAEGLKSFTDTTITTLDGLRQELATIRSQGYSVDNMEQVYGFKCVAFPVKNISGKVTAAISLSGPSLRFQDDDIKHYVELLRQTAGNMIFL